MKVFTLEAGSGGLEDLTRVVDLARETGKSVRIGVDGNELKVCLGQMMWSLPIATINYPSQEG